MSPAALVVVLAGAVPAQAEEMTLDAYVELVVSEGLQARAAASEVEIAAAEQEAAGLWPNPRLELSREHNAVGVRAGESQDRLLASLPLVVSGRLGLLRDAAGRDVEAARAWLEHARGRLRHQATAAFVDAAAARRRVAVLREAQAALVEVVEVIIARERAGEAAGYDRVRIELEARRLDDRLAAALLDERDALARARALLPPGIELAVGDESLSVALGAPAVSDVERRADARALALEIEAAELSEDAAARAVFPDPTLFTGASLLDSLGPLSAERGLGYAVGVEVPLPLFDHGQGDRARARARHARAEAERAALLHAARSRLDAALAEHEGRSERATRHEKEVVPRARELLAITSEAYRKGAAELLALVDAEREREEALVTSIDLVLSVRRAENDILLLSGHYDAAREGASR